MTEGAESSGPRTTLRKLASHPLVAPAFAVLVAACCVSGVFTLTKVFYLRDLSVYFWPHHQWLRRTIFAGQSPIWDPNPGGGYSTIGDPALHLAFLPTLPLRFLPEILGFNLSVALPFPIAAIGVFLFARRHASPWASAVAAIAYAASGPILSTGSCNNLAWCAAIIPFIFWTVDGLVARPNARHFALLAALFAIELFAGEPVTLLGSAVLAIAYASLGAPAAGASLRERARSLAVVAGAGLAGVVLSAVQALPLLDAMRRSIRGSGMLADTWSLHPMRLAETVLPFVYGNYLGLQNEMSPWLFALNSRREPYLPSLYVGAFTIVLAAAGIAAARRRGWGFFWGASLAGALLCAFGSMTPVYPALQKLVPLLANFRYPTKYAVLAMLPLAALVAVGWDGLTLAGARLALARRAATAAAFALLAAVCVFTVMSMTGAGSALLISLAGVSPDLDPATTSGWLTGSVMRLITGVMLVVIAPIWVAQFGGPENPFAPFARGAAIAVFTVNLVVMNGGLNPTIDASLLEAPDWVKATRQHPADRVHVAAEFVSIPGGSQADQLPRPAFQPDVPPAAYLAVWNTALCQYPSAWGVRQSVSLELTGLRPREYLTLLERFSLADRSEQFRFLRLTGTRYALVSKPPPPPSSLAMPLPQLAPLSMYELGEPGSRVLVSVASTVEPDTARATAMLFDPLLVPGSSAVVSAETPPAGVSGVAADAAATIVEETTTRVTVSAAAPEGGGHLVLFDSYDPGWSATVDGQPAEITRAWGVYRAVRLAPGHHTVEFRYVSTQFRVGLLITVISGLVLITLAVRRPRPAAAGNEAYS